MSTRILNPKFLPLPNTTFNNDCIKYSFEQVSTKNYTNLSLEDRNRLASLKEEERNQIISRIIAIAFRSVHSLINDGHSVIVPALGHFKFNPNAAIKIEGKNEILKRKGYSRLSEVKDIDERQNISKEISKYKVDECIENTKKRSNGKRIVNSSFTPANPTSYVVKLKF